jgi:hypothetical protein
VSPPPSHQNPSSTVRPFLPLFSRGSRTWRTSLTPSPSWPVTGGASPDAVRRHHEVIVDNPSQATSTPVATTPSCLKVPGSSPATNTYTKLSPSWVSAATPPRQCGFHRRMPPHLTAVLPFSLPCPVGPPSISGAYSEDLLPPRRARH